MARSALVTDGTRGIGAAIARLLQTSGYDVAATFFDKDDQACVFGESTGIPVFKWDVTDVCACEHGVDDVQRRMGPIDVLVNIAGIVRDATLRKMSDGIWQSVVDVDLSGCVNMCRVTVDGMRERHFGRVVNVSTVHGQPGLAFHAQANAGLLDFTRMLAVENAAHGITVNTVAPGWIGKGWIAAVPVDILRGLHASMPVDDRHEPESIARCVLFLVEAAGFITGSTLSADGGWHVPLPNATSSLWGFHHGHAHVGAHGSAVLLGG